MKKALFILLFILIAAGGVTVFSQTGGPARLGLRQAAQAPEKPLPTTVDDFRLTDHWGKSHELHRYADSRAIVLFVAGNGCPIVRQSIPKLKELRDQYAPQQVTFLMINGNAHDDRPSIAKEAAEFAVDIPILADDRQVIVAALGTKRTAEALVISPKNWKILYRGAVDDRFGYGAQKPRATHEWLKDALDAALQDRPVTTPMTAAKGCLIDFPGGAAPISYVKQVAPIIANKCVPCHSEGNIAPFAFARYEAVQGRASMVREVIRTQRMPPWHADPAYGTFANDSSLSKDEARTLIQWIEAGAPRDGEQDPLKLAQHEAPALWPLGPPDVTVAMPQEMKIPPDGVFDYVYVRVPSPLTEDAWLRGIDVQPGNRKVVHHVLIFLKYPDGLRDQEPDWHGGLEGYFAGYVPGAQPKFLPEGTGKFLPKGATIVFQLHYNATGKQEVDRTSLGLYLCKEKPALEMTTRAAFDQSFRIPAGASDYPATATFRLERDMMLWEMSPHMHYRGSRFQYEAQYPDGAREVLLSVPRYDFNWQTMYRLSDPKRLPAGTTILCSGAFDNSPKNPANPDPSRTVRFGEQTFEEMFIGYLNLTPVPQAS